MSYYNIEFAEHLHRRSGKLRYRYRWLKAAPSRDRRCS